MCDNMTLGFRRTDAVPQCVIRDSTPFQEMAAGRGSKTLGGWQTWRTWACISWNPGHSLHVNFWAKSLNWSVPGNTLPFLLSLLAGWAAAGPSFWDGWALWPLWSVNIPSTPLTQKAVAVLIVLCRSTSPGAHRLERDTWSRTRTGNLPSSLDEHNAVTWQYF